MTDGTFRVAVCQYEFAGVEIAEELCARAEGLFDQAGPADCYVLPELFAYDLTIDATGEDHCLTDEARATLHEFVTEAAQRRDAVVVGGSYRTPSDGTVVNRAPIGLPDGSLQTYDKCRPIPRERQTGTEPGTIGGPVFEHAGVNVGVLICYDIEFPMVVRDIVDRGAELLLVPSLTASEAGFQRVRRCAASRAVENQCYVVQTPLVGDHPRGEKTGTGRGTVYAPCDDVLGPDGTGLSLPRDRHTAATQSLDVTALRTSQAPWKSEFIQITTNILH